MPETAVLHLGLSELFHEQGDLQAAKRHLQRSEELGELPAFPPWHRHRVHALVRIKETEGDLEGALKILNESAQLYYRQPIPDVRPLPALIARTQLAGGSLAEAQLWADEHSLSVDDESSYLREFEHLALARILIARYPRDQDDGLIHDTIRLLERLLKAAEEGGRMGSAIEILALQALAYEAQGKLPKALNSLERALSLAEPEGYVQTFLGLGQPMAHLLHEALERENAPGYVNRLLAASTITEDAQTAPTQSSVPKSEMVEPLSEREIEVLQLIAIGLTNPEIASRLYLSLNTIKAHTRNIYGKLDVNNRTRAVVRARTLGILPPT